MELSVEHVKQGGCATQKTIAATIHAQGKIAALLKVLNVEHVIQTGNAEQIMSVIIPAKEKSVAIQKEFTADIAKKHHDPTVMNRSTVLKSVVIILNVDMTMGIFAVAVPKV